MSTEPTLEVERTHGGLVAGMDEVGRGALAGPVAVGVVVVGDATVAPPEGLRDSKLLSCARRESLVEPVRCWAVASAVGMASAAEVDAHGIIGALRRAGLRALHSLPCRPDVVLLDGSHDWLTDPLEVGLLAPSAQADGEASLPSVITRVKADLSCASVAGASVLAKVARDALMVGLDAEVPGYGFAAHKGYASAAHQSALGRLGASSYHRLSWRLPGVVYGGSAGKELRDER